ncbi:exporter of polyketide antibiotics [soil metagenome]
MRTLLWMKARRERWILPIWILGIVGLLAASGTAILREFGDESERAAVVSVAATSPAFLFLRGLPDGTSVGAVVFFQTFAFLAVLVGLMNTFLVTRHTRADEESGRAEMVSATRLPRSADLVSTLVLAFAVNALLTLLCSAVGLALGFGATASALMGGAVGAVGFAFAGIAAVVAQLVSSSRAANGAAAATVGIAYLVRGLGDSLGTVTGPTNVDSSWVSALSPIGWAQASAPFSSANPLPLLALVSLGGGTAALAIAFRARRDLGWSLIAQGTGRAEWRGASGGRLALRLQRGTIVGWAVGAAVLGLLAGTFSPVAAAAVDSNDTLRDLIARLSPGLEVDTASVFAVALLGIAGTLAAAAGIQAIIRMRADEAEDRAEFLLSTGLSRAGWLLRQAAAAALSMTVVALVAGLAAGVSFVVAGDSITRIPISLGAVAVHLPAGSVFVAATAVIVGWIPRATAGLGWGLLVVGLVVGQLGGLLGLPEWVQNASPFRHVPAVPLEDVDPAPIVLFLLISVVMFAAAVVGIRRRDIQT